MIIVKLKATIRQTSVVRSTTELANEGAGAVGVGLDGADAVDAWSLGAGVGAIFVRCARSG